MNGSPFQPLGLVIFVGALGCRGGTTEERAGIPKQPPYRVEGGVDVDGARVSLGVDGERFVAIGDIDDGARRVDLSGRFVVPAFIDSHVHLAYYAVAPELPAGGVAGVVDFAAPIATMEESFPIFVRHAGPMITPLLGYPTQSWGSGGFGLEVASPDEARSAVDRLLDAGASFIKTPLLGSSGVDDETLGAVVEAAHARGARVAVHALAAADATRAIASSVDILAHTPTETLTPDVLAAWGERAVVGTLSAFGSSTAALTNLKALADGGALVLYGTDLGNTREVGIQGAEIDALVRAGFTVSDIVHSATDRAASFWDLSELGRLEAGRRASFLVLSEDPSQNPLALTTPEAVVIDGKVVKGSLP